MATEAVKLGLNVVLIEDSNINIYMQKCQKVFIGCHAITQDGGLISIVGTK